MYRREYGQFWYLAGWGRPFLLWERLRTWVVKILRQGVRGGHEAHTWRAGRGSGQGRGGGRTRRTGTLLRVGKGHDVVRGVHFQTPFSLCSRARGPALSLCVCFRLAVWPRNSLFCCACAICIVLVLRCVLCLASIFVVALHLQFSVKS